LPSSLFIARRHRITLGGYVCHVLNRANGRLRIFRKAGDFLAFENEEEGGWVAIVGSESGQIPAMRSTGAVVRHAAQTAP
jgi:hypothetical protein